MINDSLFVCSILNIFLTHVCLQKFKLAFAAYTYVDIYMCRFYLQMMSAIKSGHVAYSRFARMAEMEEAQHEKEILKKQISVERSGGGL